MAMGDPSRTQGPELDLFGPRLGFDRPRPKCRTGVPSIGDLGARAEYEGMAVKT